MKWHAVDSATVVIARSCDAPDLPSARTALQPTASEFVVSDASWRTGRFRPIAEEPITRHPGNKRPRTDAERAKISASMKALFSRGRLRRGKPKDR